MKNAQIGGKPLLVLNVQNQYKDIAHIIEKDDKNTSLCKNWFYSLTKFLPVNKKIFETRQKKMYEVFRF